MEIVTSNIFALLASLIALAVEGRYIYTIIRRRTIPNFTGWFIIALSMTFVFFSSLSAWVGSTIWLIGTLAILHTIEAILSFFYGSFRMTRLDKALICIAFSSLALWYATNNPLYTLCINTLIDSCGMLAIAYKLFRFPETEDMIAWWISVLIYGLDILAIREWNFANSFFLVMNFIECGIIFLLTFRHMHILGKIRLQLALFFHIKI